MSSSPEPSRRRRNRSDIEDEEDADDVRTSQRPSPNGNATKRARTVDRDDESDSDSSEIRLARSNTGRGDEEDLEDAEELEFGGDNEDQEDDPDSGTGIGRVGRDGFQPGSIRRVKVTNFVTYERAEFFPGPNLNMVIGPNGTGKSSLVCAICLGLGLGPTHLGRAGEVGEFVKHGSKEAEIEIELEKKARDARNYVVRVRIVKDGNKREWYLQGTKTTLKAVQELTRSLSIQIDNLCQFLPQDKVSEFAALSPVDLLLQTQRAAAPEEMILQHEQLKANRKEQKKEQQKQAEDQEKLESLENRQQNLQSEVQRLQERQQIQDKINILKLRIPFLKYNSARAAHYEYKNKKIEAQQRLRTLKARVKPLLETVTVKETQRNQILNVVKEREYAIRRNEQATSAMTEKMDALEVSLNANHDALALEGTKDNARKVAYRKTQQEITRLENLMKQPQIEFDAKGWNDRIVTLAQEARELHNKGLGQRNIYDAYAKTSTAKQQELADTELELTVFESVEGQQVSKLESISRDTARAWKWINDNRDKFEKEVYGPPIVSCSVKDRKYVDHVESLFQKNDFLAFTCQTAADYNTLTRSLFNDLHLGDITLRSIGDKPLSAFPHPSSNVKGEYGFDHWALDLLDGPEPVLVMLCQGLKLNATGISLNDTSDEQHTKIVQGNLVNSWVSRRLSHRITRRAEYGASATSVAVKQIGTARYWTDRPVDASKREEISARIDAIKEALDELKAKAGTVRVEIDKFAIAKKEKIEEEKSIKAEKAKIQRAWTEQQALPAQIEAEKVLATKKQDEAYAIQRNLAKLSTQRDELVLQKARCTLDLHDLIKQLRTGHQNVVEAKIWLIETDSDIASLVERNGNIRDQVAREEELARMAEIESNRHKEVARQTQAMCQEIKSDPVNDPLMAEITADLTMSVETVEQEIAAEESRLEFIHATNPNAIRDFEARQKELDALRNHMQIKEEKLAKLERRINKTRSRWEPELDKLISKISEAFSYNFEQIGCAGEVSIHKDDDFELWAIQIKVRFRENEMLQLLDAHRQSGGERSVSTIFYLMSLQSMARAPFRVVDEINQGMDPRNERMVHERMVEIACKEHTSQYFLITPKLLTGLRYDKRMKILCIASGEHMPANYTKLDVAKIIGIQRSILAAG